MTELQQYKKGKQVVRCRRIPGLNNAWAYFWRTDTRLYGTNDLAWKYHRLDLVEQSGLRRLITNLTGWQFTSGVQKMSELKVRRIDWHFQASDCVRTLEANVHFSRPYWCQFSKAYKSQKFFRYGLSRGCKPFFKTDQEFKDLAAKKLEVEIKKFLEEYNKNEKDTDFPC